MRWAAGKLYSGGKDGLVRAWDTQTQTELSKIDFDGVLIRAIDVMGEWALVGLRDGSIFKALADGQFTQRIHESHSDGEVWGLAVIPDGYVLTTGDDNKIKLWNTKTRKVDSQGTICNEDRKVKRGGASTLSTFADSKCSRAIAVNKVNGHVAIGHNDGTLTIRNSTFDLDVIISEHHDAKEWIEDIEYSPDGSKLAVASHDNNIYVYSAGSDHSLLGVCSKHNSFVTSIDWSQDGRYIRSVCGAYELLFFNAEDCTQDTNGASNTTSVLWATNNAKFGWSVEGVFPAGTDGTHINYVDFSNDQTLIATGDDYGLVNLFRNPCRKGHKPVSLRGHSEHVVRVGFSEDDSYLFSIGGYDQTLMQWKRV